MLKSKNLKVLLIAVAALMLFACMGTRIAVAEEATQDGIIVETKFDKSSYISEDDKIYSVYIQNTNSEVVKIDSLKIEPPKGYTLSEELDGLTASTVQPGESVLLKYYLT